MALVAAGAGRVGRGVAVLAAAMVAFSSGVVRVEPVAATPALGARSAPDVAQTVSVDVRAVRGRSQAPAAVAQAVPVKVVWPGESAVSLGVLAAGRVTRAGSSPVRVRAVTGSSAPVSVSVFGRDVAAGTVGTGVVFAVAGARAGRVNLSLDYTGFAVGGGADWGARLKLVALPGCALVTPGKAACRSVRELGSVNDVAGRRVSADVDLGVAQLVPAAAAIPAGARSASIAGAVSGAGAAAGGGGVPVVVVAAVAGTASPAGDFGATDLSAASSWSAGGSNGDFTWRYPLRTPSVAGGLSPDLSISYSAQSTDGRTSTSNNQPSWVGEGMDLSVGSIERKYASCADEKGKDGANNTAVTGDLCWFTDGSKTNDQKWDNATLSLGSHSGELVRVGNTSTWKIKHDDGTRIEKIGGYAGGSLGSEHWKVTTTDGTQYFFGVGKAAGASAGATNSRWSVPVAGNHVGEPGHAASFGSSFATRPYRWNLDYVVTPTGDTMTYYYVADANFYKQNMTTRVSYIRGGYLTRIAYGQRAGAEGAAPAAQVVFTVAERCLTSVSAACLTANPTAASAAAWPDVPVDAICTATSCPSEKTAPTFFTRKRLAVIDTQVRNAAGTGYDSVDSWALTPSFPATNDGTSPGLWLAGIAHTGRAGTALTLPRTTFTPVVLDNRIVGPGNGTAFRRPRMGTITTESGGKVHVSYTPVDCTASSLPVAATNTRRCFPVYYSLTAAAPVIHWFHKYVVTKVIEQDVAQIVDEVATAKTNIADAVSTSWVYGGGGAWKYDDSPMTPVKYRTWGIWRGYAKVTTIKGSAPATPIVDEALFFRGMHGNRNAAGRKVAVSVTDSTGATWTDEDTLAGVIREKRTLRAWAGAEDWGQIVDPWQSAATASDGRNTAKQSGDGATRTRQVLAAGGYRRSASATLARDAYGQPSIYENQGDTSVSGDETCTRTTYAGNTTSWIVDRIAEKSVAPGLCSVAVNDATVLERSRSYYDGSTTLREVPGPGLQTWATSYTDTGGTRAWRDAEKNTYDIHGRKLTSADPLGRTTTTAYTPVTGSLVTGMTVTSPDPDGTGPLTVHQSVSTFDRRTGATTKTVQAGGLTYESDRDALGRVIRVWTPGRAKSAYPTTPTIRYTYTLNVAGVTATKTETLNTTGGYTATTTVFDSLLRSRQVQQSSPVGGRIITDTRYNSVGQVSFTGTFYNSAEPSAQLVEPSTMTLVQTATQTTYDFRGRTLIEAFVPFGVEKWRTTNVYRGDRVTTTPPSGGTPTTTIADIAGHTTALLQHLGTTTSAPAATTSYAYDRLGRMTSMTDPKGNTWTYQYDMAGNKTRVSDPDKGVTTSTYTATGKLATTTDARGQKITYSYDNLDRVTATKDGSGTTVTASSYDTLLKGQPTATTRYISGAAITNTVTGYNAAGQALGAKTVIPAVSGIIDAALAGTYTTSTAYNTDGSVASSTLPAMGSVPAETLNYAYTSTGSPTTLTGTINGANLTYVSATAYAGRGEVTQLTMGAVAGKQTWLTYDYDDDTRRLTWIRLDRQNTPAPDEMTTYTYDPAGNITKAVATRPTGGNDTACYRYDYQRQLTDAWTPASGDCTTTRATTALAGPAPYWNTWTNDTLGRTTTRTARTPTTTATTTYTYNADGTSRPHFITAAATTTASGTTTKTYTADAAGNTTSRTGSTGQQTLTWNTTGNLEKVTDPTGTIATLAYGPDGTRLIRRDATTTTLYLAGTELHLTRATGTLKAQRYYTHAGNTIAVREGATTATLTTLINDHQGSIHHQINNATGALSTTWADPYGNPRTTTAATWIGERGFVGGTKDTTGLTHLGAREYDPQLGRFISVDPLQTTGDPLSWNAYIYADNNPVTYSDPTGTCLVVGDNCNWPKTPPPSGSKKPSKPSSSGSSPRGSSSVPASVCGYCNGSGYGPAAAENIPPPQPPNPVADAVRDASAGIVRAGADSVLDVGQAISAGLGCVGGWLFGDGCGNGAQQATAWRDTADQALDHVEDSFGVDRDSAWHQGAYIATNTAMFATGFGGAAKAAISGTLRVAKMVETVDKMGDTIRATIAAERSSLGLSEAVSLSAKPSSKRLGANLEAAGHSRAAGSAAHHIVAVGSPKAIKGRSILQRFDIDLDSAENGVFLPANSASPNRARAAVHSQSSHQFILLDSKHNARSCEESQ